MNIETARKLRPGQYVTFAGGMPFSGTYPIIDVGEDADPIGGGGPVVRFLLRKVRGGFPGFAEYHHGLFRES